MANPFIGLPTHPTMAKHISYCNKNPPTPAFAKAGAAPGTTAGVELFQHAQHAKAT